MNVAHLFAVELLQIILNTWLPPPPPLFSLSVFLQSVWMHIINIGYWTLVGEQHPLLHTSSLLIKPSWNVREKMPSLKTRWDATVTQLHLRHCKLQHSSLLVLVNDGVNCNTISWAIAKLFLFGCLRWISRCIFLNKIFFFSLCNKWNCHSLWLQCVTSILLLALVAISTCVITKRGLTKFNEQFHI